DISAGVTFSLKAVGDFAAFSIDANTGEVTLTGNPDFEGQSSYSFTVLADDGVNPLTEKAVTLAINNLDDVAPSAPSITQVEDDQSPGLGNLTSGGKTNDTQPTIRISLAGTNAEENEQVQLYDGAATLGAAIILSALNISNGFIDITPDTLTNGNSYDLSATVTDQADNESAHSTTFPFTRHTHIA